MSVPCEKMIPFGLPNYRQLICDYDAAHRTLWYYLNPQPRACFTPALLSEIRDLQQRVAAHLAIHPDDIHYLILASAKPNVFNLGGDLELFTASIKSADREALRRYGRACVDAVYHNATNLGVPTLTTISLVQGSALGGGFEAAFSSNVLVAEQGAEMGFPEILFNLFPGMGAYSLLARRMDIARAERLLHSGQIHDATYLWNMGVVDVLANNGEGVHAVNNYIRQHRRARNGHQALQQVAQRVAPVKHDELNDVVDIWVDAALRLTPRDLRMMMKFVNAQSRLEMSVTEVEPPRLRLASERGLPVVLDRLNE